MKILLLLALALPSFGAIGLTPSTLTFHWTQGGQVRDFSQNVSVTGSGSFTVTQVASSCTTAGINYNATPSSGTATATVAISVSSTTFTPAIGTLSCTLQFDTGVELTIDVVVQRPLMPAPYVVTMNHELAETTACTYNSGFYPAQCNTPANAPAPGKSGSLDLAVGDVNTDVVFGGEFTTIKAEVVQGFGHSEQRPVSVDGEWIAVASQGGGYDIIKTTTPFTAYHKTTTNFSTSCPWVSKTGDVHRIICWPDNQSNVYEFLFDATDGDLTSSTIFTSAYTLYNGGTQHATSDVWISGKTTADIVVLIDVDGGEEYTYDVGAELGGCSDCINYTQANGPDANSCHWLTYGIPASATPTSGGVPVKRSKTFKHCPGDGATLTKVSDGWGSLAPDFASQPVVYLDPTLNLAATYSSNLNIGFGHGSVAMDGTTPVMVGAGDNGIFSGVNNPSYRVNGTYGDLSKGDDAALPNTQTGGGYEAWRKVPWYGDAATSSTGNGIVLMVYNNETSGNLESHVITSMTTGASTVLTFADDPGWAMGDEIRIGMVEGVTGLNGLVHTVSAATGAVVTISTSTSGTYTASTGLAIENIEWSLENRYARGLAWVRLATGQAILATKGWSVTAGPTTTYTNQDAIGYWQQPHAVCNRDCSTAAFITNGGYPSLGHVMVMRSPFADVDENTASYEFDKNGHGIYATPTADGATVDVIVPSGSLSCSFDYSLYTDLSSPTNSTGTAAQTWSFTLSGLAASTTYYFRGSCDNFYYGIGSFTTATPSGEVTTRGGQTTIGGGVQF